MNVLGAGDSVIWQEVECGGFEADLPLWAGLAEGHAPVLELGCGSGRVALDLARRGHDVWGVDTDPALIADLEARAADEQLEVHAVMGDAAELSLEQRFGLIVAPMQLIQLLPDGEARRSCLSAVAAHLAPGAIAALAIVESGETGIPPSPPFPDVREVEGWVYSSMPLGVIREADSLLVERLRQSVDPDGRLTDTRDAIRLQLLSAEALEDEAHSAGLTPAGRRQINATDAHVGSTVVLLEA